MSRRTSNIGEVGVSSIRIDGMRIEDLPMAPNAHAKQGIPLALDLERQQKIENIVARFPKPSILYLESRVTECKENIVRVAKLKGDCKAGIIDYRGLIKKCEGKPTLRELQSEISEIAATEKSFEEKKSLIHELKKTAADYEPSALEEQIEKFEESIVRCDQVLQQENDSIAELKLVIGKCQIRDLELRNLGAKRAA